MKNKFFLIISLCLFATCVTAKEKLTRNYATTNLDERLAVTMLDVGTTSFTFSVEWSPDVEFPERQLYLMSKLDTKEPYWDAIAVLYIDPIDRTEDSPHEHYSKIPVESGLAHRKAVFEIPDDSFPGLYIEEMTLASKITFSVTIPDPNFTGLESIEAEVRAAALAVATAEAEVKNAEHAETQVLSMPSREKQLEKSNEELEMEDPAKANNVWLYLLVSFCAICVVLYVLRKKRT